MAFDCLDVGCHDCCVDTRMPLSLGDIKHLKDLGYRVEDFVVLHGGERRLKNLNGCCFFLSDAGCTVYADRPTGCRFYPLVLDWHGQGLVDMDCRQRDRFIVDRENVNRLRGFIRLLKRERHYEL